MKVKELFERCDLQKVSTIITTELKFKDSDLASIIKSPSIKEQLSPILKFASKVDGYLAEMLKLKEKDCSQKTLHINVYSNDLSDTDLYFTENEDAERYALEMQDWKEVLGMSLWVDSINNLTDEEEAALIFWEMTFFGWTYKQHQKEVKKLGKHLAREMKRLNKERK